jgi:hypothetical protein
MPAYDSSRFNPPAPLALVTLRNPKSGVASADQLLQIDSGADATLLPRSAVASIGIEPLAGEQYELIGFDGKTSVAFVANVDVVFLNRRFRGKYLLMDGEVGVLGRDVLNHLRLLLDGPRQEWSKHTEK